VLPVVVKIDAKSVAAAVSAPVAAVLVTAAVSAPVAVVPLPATSVTAVWVPAPDVPVSVIFVIVSGRNEPSDDVRPSDANAC